MDNCSAYSGMFNKKKKTAKQNHQASRLGINLAARKHATGLCIVTVEQSTINGIHNGNIRL